MTVAGSYVGKRIVDRLPERVFIVIIEFVLAAAGLEFLIGGRLVTQRRRRVHSSQSFQSLAWSQ